MKKLEQFWLQMMWFFKIQTLFAQLETSLRQTFLKNNSVFLFRMCDAWRKFRPIASENIFRISEPETDRNCAGTDWKRERKRTSVRNSLNREQRAHGPLRLWLSICAQSLSLLRGCLSCLLWIRPGSPSVENWIGVDVCTRERKTAGEEMLMIFMGNKQDIYLQFDRCTWPLGWFSYT